MLVLASRSPRRQELLRNAGIDFTVQPADIDESPLPGEPPRECAERLAREKALRVWKTRPRDVVLGADTIVVVETRILNKPTDAADAARMLGLLSGRSHEVITGVCVVKPVAGARLPVGRSPGVEETLNRSTPQGSVRAETPQIWVASESTLIVMHPISEDEIREYVATGEPMDKAGAYAIQGGASRWIRRIEGDYRNVVGLPVALVQRICAEHQVK
jgi:septum formation protein